MRAPGVLPTPVTRLLTVQDLFEAQTDKLRLRWVAGRAGGKRPLEQAAARFPGMALVGHLNTVHPNRVQVLGKQEIGYLKRLAPTARSQAIHNLFRCPTTAIVIVSGDQRVPASFSAAAENAGLPLLKTPLPSPKVINHLQFYLARALAAHIAVHGVFMEVLGLGLLLTGEPGIGKSELALELLSRGHRLIADDGVELSRIAPDALLGRCPDLLRDFLEVRGLGLLNARAIFGDIAIRPEKTLRLIVRLSRLTAGRARRLDRLKLPLSERVLLDVTIPEVNLFVAPGRNLAVLVETAARSHILRMRGQNPLAEFLARHRAHMQANVT